MHEKTLEFQVVTKYLELRTLDALNIEDQTITQAKGFGVAVFKDGRIGTLDFITVIDKRKSDGTGFGFTTYTFDDGSITRCGSSRRSSPGGNRNHAQAQEDGSRRRKRAPASLHGRAHGRSQHLRLSVCRER